MRVEQARRLKELEKENTRLKKLVADIPWTAYGTEGYVLGRLQPEVRLPLKNSSLTVLPDAVHRGMPAPCTAAHGRLLSAGYQGGLV